MTIDWITIAATFGAAIAGSWLGARATERQTSATVLLAKDQWRKERAFELIGCLDEYLSHSFRSDLDDSARDKLSRRALALTSIVIPARTLELEQDMSYVRQWHLSKKNDSIVVPKGTSYSKTEGLISSIRKDALEIAITDINI